MQAHLARWIDTPAGLHWLQTGYEANAEVLQPSTRQLLRNLYGTESDRIRSADPIFVSSEMVDVIDAAMGSFEPEPLLPTDLMTTHGFVLYEKPFQVPDRFDEPTSIQGFSWMPTLSPDVAERLTGKLSQADPGDKQAQAAIILEELRQRYGSDNPDNVNGIFLTVYAQSDHNPEYIARHGPTPAVVPMHFTPWWFGMSFEGNEYDENGKPTGATWWWKILQTTLRLMQQTLSVGHRYRPDKAGRRAYRAARLPEDRDVVVVRLRREKQSGPADDGPHGEANYSHRFIRNPHWRWQWYPSIKSHRQIWIHATIVGDESLPLIIRPNRAFTWNR